MPKVIQSLAGSTGGLHDPPPRASPQYLKVSPIAVVILKSGVIDNIYDGNEYS